MPHPHTPLGIKSDAPSDSGPPGEPLGSEPMDLDPGFSPETVGPEALCPESVELPPLPGDGGPGLVDPVQGLPSGFELGMVAIGLYGLGAFVFGGAILVTAMGVTSKYGRLDAMNPTSALHRLNDTSEDGR
jgi:hypothetical protein